MSIKKLGIVLFLLLTVIGFSCSSVNAKYENDWQMPVSIGGDTGDSLKGYSSTDEKFKFCDDPNEYDHCPGKKGGWTWLAMNNDIKVMIVRWCGINGVGYYKRIKSSKWGNDVDNIDYLWVESENNNYPVTKLYLKNGTIIDTDEWEHYSRNE